MTEGKGGVPPGAMTLYEHWVVDCAVKHNAAMTAARCLDSSASAGRTAAAAEVSRLSVALFEKLHGLATLVREYGADEVFGLRSTPLSQEQKEPAEL